MTSKPVARLGDQAMCPKDNHGPQPVVSGSQRLWIDGMQAARVGDVFPCGASIAMGSVNVLVDGLPVARMGDMTSHGGVIATGSSKVFIG